MPQALALETVLLFESYGKKNSSTLKTGKTDDGHMMTVNQCCSLVYVAYVPALRTKVTSQDNIAWLSQHRIENDVREKKHTFVA